MAFQQTGVPTIKEILNKNILMDISSMNWNKCSLRDEWEPHCFIIIMYLFLLIVKRKKVTNSQFKWPIGTVRYTLLKKKKSTCANDRNSELGSKLWAKVGLFHFVCLIQDRRRKNEKWLFHIFHNGIACLRYKRNLQTLQLCGPFLQNKTTFVRLLSFTS